MTNIRQLLDYHVMQVILPVHRSRLSNKCTLQGMQRCDLKHKVRKIALFTHPPRTNS